MAQITRIYIWVAALKIETKIKYNYHTEAEITKSEIKSVNINLLWLLGLPDGTALTHRIFKNIYFRCEFTGVCSPVIYIS